MAKTNPTGADGKRHHENLHTDSCSWRAMSINSAHHSTASLYEQVTDSRPAYFFALTLLSLLKSSVTAVVAWPPRPCNHVLGLFE